MASDAQRGAPRPRLYLSTPPQFDPADFAGTLEQALSAGDVACLRLRLADAGEEALLRAAKALKPVCHRHDVALLVSDYFRMVKPAGLDGVHFEGGHNAQKEAREALGPDAVIGVSCGASRDRGLAAGERGADYVSFGPVAVDQGLRVGDTAERDLFVWWQEMIELPVVAEGGMSPELAESLCGAVDFIAVRRSVCEHPDGPGAGVAAYQAAIDRGMARLGR